MPPRIGTGTAACFLVGWWGLRWLERRLCGAVVAAVPRKRSGNRRCVSWSKGTGCGGAASLFFGERRVRTRFPSPPLFAAIARCLRFRSSPPASPLPVAFPRLLSPAACRPLPPPLSASPLLPAVPPLLTSRTRCLPFPPPCAGRADRWAAAAPRVVGRGAMRRRREVLRNNLENRKILSIFVSVKYRGSGLSRPGFLFFIGLSFLWQKRLSI